MTTLGCAETLPSDVANYREDENCTRINRAPLPRRADDPHEGEKNVYACNVPLDALKANERPFPEGAIIIKESIREDSGYPWLVATARKKAGAWKWDEYSRNFEDEDFVHILPGEQVCIDCHAKVKGGDWIYTLYSRDADAALGDAGNAGELGESSVDAGTPAD